MNSNEMDELKQALNMETDAKELERQRIPPNRSLNIINDRAIVHLSVDRGLLRLEQADGFIHVMHSGKDQYNKSVIVAAYNDKVISFFGQSADLKVQTILL